MSHLASCYYISAVCILRLSSFGGTCLKLDTKATCNCFDVERGSLSSLESQLASKPGNLNKTQISTDQVHKGALWNLPNIFRTYAELAQLTQQIGLHKGALPKLYGPSSPVELTQHFQIFPNMFRCFQTISVLLFPNPFRCSPIFSDVFQQFQMFPNMFRCVQTFSDVSQHLQMFPNIFRFYPPFSEFTHPLSLLGPKN